MPNRKTVRSKPPKPLPAVATAAAEAPQADASARRIIVMHETFDGTRRLLITVEELADLLAIGLPKAWELVLKQQVKSIHVGRLRRIPVSAVLDYIEQRQAEVCA